MVMLRVRFSEGFQASAPLASIAARRAASASFEMAILMLRWGMSILSCLPLLAVCLPQPRLAVLVRAFPMQPMQQLVHFGPFVTNELRLKINKHRLRKQLPVCG